MTLHARKLCIMNYDTQTSDRQSDHSMSFNSSAATPVDVFYVVHNANVCDERAHFLRSDLYETQPQAEAELARLRQANAGNSYSLWKSVTYIEPAEWLHRAVRSDGTLILPRLHGVEKLEC
jgi:hypothetical protein